MEVMRLQREVERNHDKFIRKSMYTNVLHINDAKKPKSDGLEEARQQHGLGGRATHMG